MGIVSIVLVKCSRQSNAVNVNDQSSRLWLTQVDSERVAGVQTALIEMEASVYSGEDEPPTTSVKDDDVIDAEFVDSPQ